jgi:Arc/MetJ-type ribon-helix-helix transcriptional regulator
MAKTKIAVTIDGELLEALDEMVAKRQFPNRSQALEIALAEKLERLGRSRLGREAALLDPEEERRMAEEGMGELTEWPAY